MRPEFVPMLAPMYPNLRSHEGLVCGARNRAPACARETSYFWAHSHPEVAQRSVANPGEADMAVRLAAWFVAEGYEPGAVTILAPYNGQVSLIRQKTSANEELASVLVCTIDKYQGDENSIVIVSLVRSNEEGRIGHVAMPNRLCVAASRGRCGVYFLGNPTALCKKAACWRTLIDYMRTQSLVGPEIPLVCPRHPDDAPFLIPSARPGALKPRALCTKMCVATLPCGHACTGGCHSGDHRVCQEVVAFNFDTCGHPGRRLCSETPGRCQKRVQFEFQRCGHSGECDCWQSKEAAGGEGAIRCTVACTRVLQGCGHPCPLECGDDCATATCPPCEDLEKERRNRERKAAIRQRKQKLQEVDEEIRRLKERGVDEGYITRKLLPRGDTAAKYFEVKDRTEKYVQTSHKTIPVVESIEEVINLQLQLRWLEAQREMRDPTHKTLLFHGTSKERARAICESGFELPPKDKKNMFGQGCYFAPDSSKSAQYGDGLILCEVLLGKTMTVETAQDRMDLRALRGRGYDSLFSKRGGKATGGTHFDEFVIYDPRQAIPRFLVRFKTLGVHDPRVGQLAAEAAAVRDGKMARIPLVPNRDYAGDTPEDYHFRIAESQFYRMTTNRSLKVTKVEYVVNPELEARYEATKAALRARLGSAPKERLLFHGTDRTAIDKIALEGFRIGGQDVPIKCGAAFGQGVYTAEDPSISVSYSGGSGMMLLSLGLPGKEGEDWKPGGGQHIMVIQTSGQLLPRYIVHFGAG